MGFISLAFNEILYQPLFNGLVFLYNIIPFHDFGISIILLTLIIRLIIYPLNQKAIKSQKRLTELQPQIKEIQQKHKGDKMKQSQSLTELYKKNQINPASGCLPLLLQFPVLIALYQVFLKVLNPESLSALYPFVTRPEVINPLFLGFVNLAKSNYIMAILAGILTFAQSKMMMSSNKSQSASPDDFSATLNKQMLYVMPLVTVFIAWKLPAGLALYWVATTVFGIVQQYLVIRKKNGKAIVSN